MIDIRNDELIPLQNAAPVVARYFGREPHINTLHRWAAGRQIDVPLETVRIGGSRLATTEDAIIRFFEANATGRRMAPRRPQRRRLVPRI